MKHTIRGRPPALRNPASTTSIRARVQWPLDGSQSSRRLLVDAGSMWPASQRRLRRGDLTYFDLLLRPAPRRVERAGRRQAPGERRLGRGCSSAAVAALALASADYRCPHRRRAHDRCRRPGLPRRTDPQAAGRGDRAARRAAAHPRWRPLPRRRGGPGARRRPRRSDVVIRDLARHHPFVRPVWLARNFGQHAATLAGMSSTSADWIVTMDEDGQHDPSAIGAMLDVALSTRRPSSTHGRRTRRRTACSATSRAAARTAPRGSWAREGSTTSTASASCSARSAEASPPTAARASTSTSHSPGSFIRTDVVPGRDARGARPPVRLLDPAARLALLADGADLRHASAPTGRAVRARARPLGVRPDGLGRVGPDHRRGAGAGLDVRDGHPPRSRAVGRCFSLGIVAEYLGIAARSAMGKPLYLVVSDADEGPLGRAGQSVARGRAGTRARPRSRAVGERTARLGRGARRSSRPQRRGSLAKTRSSGGRAAPSAGTRRPRP